MRKSYKWTLGAVASLAIGCGFLGTALITEPVEALAEDAGAPVSYVNVGASEALEESEFYYENASLASDSSDAGTTGVDESGLGVFATYRTQASVSVTVEAGEYQVAALVDADGAVTVNGGEAVSANGKRIISTAATATDSGITVTTEENVKLYAVMIAPVNSKILMHSEWTENQVVVYGKLIQDELTRGCPAYYSDGSVENAVEYTSIPAGIGDGSTGVNENFNSVTATGTFKATDTKVTRNLIVMPEKLVYFVNAGSVIDHVGPFGDDSDPNYGFNQTVFDYYKSVGSTLKNDGVPDADSTGANVFGHYENGWNGGDKSLPYPFNTGRVTRSSDFGTTNLGFRLPDVEAGSYRLYIGTVSYWHGRTLGVKINNQSMGNISAPPARVVNTFDIKHAGGTVDIYLTGASTNEALASFVALQKAEDVPEEAPAALTSEAKVVGLTDTSLQVSGVQEGARVQIYGGSRPYKLIYEEIATAENFADGVYTLNYGEEKAELVAKENKIYAVQLTSGGYGGTHEFSVTDIQNFKVQYIIDGETYDRPQFTTGNIVLKVSAHAASGLDYYTVRKDYDALERHDLGSEYEMNVEYDVKENGAYEFVVYSLLGVSYSERVVISQIDRVAPTLTLSPVSAAGAWENDRFPVKVSVNSVSDVEKYEVVRGGEVILGGNVSESGEGSLNEFVLELTEAGEYLVTVTNSAKQSATATVVVGNKPVYSTLQKMPRGSDVQLTFGCIEGYSLGSLTVYRLSGTTATKLSVLGVDQVEIYSEGSYAAVIKTNEGTTEVYSFEIKSEDFKKAANSSQNPGGNNNGGYTGTIVAACIFGVALIGLAVLLVMRKKKPALQTAQTNAGNSIEEEKPAVNEPAEEPERVEPQAGEETPDPEEDDER